MGTYPNITFTMQAMVNGVSYLGSGRTSKVAKANAAEKALRALDMWDSKDDAHKTQRDQSESFKYRPPPPAARKAAPKPPSTDPRGAPWSRKEKPFKSVMSNKWTNFTAGGELGTTTGLSTHGIYTSKVEVKHDASGEYSYQASDYGYGYEQPPQPPQQAPPPPPPPPQQQFDPSMYGYGTEYPAPDPYAAPVAFAPAPPYHYGAEYSYGPTY